MLPEKRRNALAIADNALLIVGAIVVGLFALKLFGFLIGTVLFAIKIAIVVFIVAAAVRLTGVLRRS
jgi:hypothetical protein